MGKKGKQTGKIPFFMPFFPVLKLAFQKTGIVYYQWVRCGFLIYFPFFLLKFRKVEKKPKTSKTELTPKKTEVSNFNFQYRLKVWT